MEQNTQNNLYLPHKF